MKKINKVLVTGGAGFIASHVVDLLLKKGYEVIIVDNLYSGYKKNINPQAKFYENDITNFNELSKIFEKEKPDFVIHAAAQIQVIYSLENPQFDALTNIIGGINVLECSRNFNIQKIVYLSTGGALYGEPEYLPADEEHPIKPISAYGASKRALEYYLYLYNINYNLDFVGLRFSNVYGVRDDLKSNRVIPNFIKSFLENKKPFITGDGGQGRDFIYVGDVVEAIILALEKETKDKFFNIGTEKIISMNELFSSIKNILDSDLEPEYVEARKGEVQQIYLKNKKAREQLGWKPTTDLNKGLEKTIKWFKEVFNEK